MDARRPAFLEGQVDFDASRFEVAGDRAIVNGVLAAPSARCMYIASARLDSTLQLDRDATYRLELDMYVSELAGLEVKLSPVRPVASKSELVSLWLDDTVNAAWQTVVESGRDLVARHDSVNELGLRDGNCVFAGRVAASDRERMAHIVALVRAIADVPERRMRELASGVVNREVIVMPPRLRLGGDGVVVAGDIVIAAACEADRLHTTIRAQRPSSAPLVVVDKELSRRHRPHSGKLAVQGRWLVEGVLAPEIQSRLAMLRPSAITANQKGIVIDLGGFAADPARLSAALELVDVLSGLGMTAPYR